MSLSSQELEDIAQTMADLLETSMIEVSDIIDDFSENLENTIPPRSAVKVAALMRKGLKEYGPLHLVEAVMDYGPARQKVLEVLAYMVAELDTWEPEGEEEEEEDEDLF